MITRSSIYHRPTDEYAYPIDKHTLHIKLRTRKEEVQTVQLLFGDQYEWKDGAWISQQIEMEKVATDALFDYWLLSIQPTYKRIRYGFFILSLIHI